MKSLRELLAVLRIAHAHLAVRQNERDIANAQERLALALAARDQAVANLHIVEGQQNTQEVPAYLLKRKD